MSLAVSDAFLSEVVCVRIWAIADLHLGTAVEKPMDVFGPQWANHAEVIGRNWKARVAPGDTVLVPGDISWGLRLAEARPDLELIGTWPRHQDPGQGKP